MIRKCDFIIDWTGRGLIVERVRDGMIFATDDDGGDHEVSVDSILHHEPAQRDGAGDAYLEIGENNS